MSGGALSPAGALAWLGSLSIDLRATAVLGTGGECLAGDAALARRAATMLETGPERAVEARGGGMLAVRSERHAVAAAVGPHALERLVLADLRAALAALDRA